MHVRYYAPFRQRSGFGRAADGYALAFGTTALNVTYSSTSTFEVLRADRDADSVVIVHLPPISAGKVGAALADSLHLGTQRPIKRIAMTTVETLDVPDQVLSALACFDEIWVPSKVAQNAFLPPYRRRVHVVPHVAMEPIITEYTSPKHRPFRFYWIGAWDPRKNPAGIISAFYRTFGTTESVELHLLTNADEVQRTTALARTGFSITNGQRNLRWYAPDNGRSIVEWLHMTGDCFVSAPYGEAWNLPAFEALQHGRMIITTKGIGSDQYLAGTNAIRIPARPTPAQLGVDVRADEGELVFETLGVEGQNVCQRWLDPDLIALGLAMRRVFTARTRTIKATYDPRARYSPAAIGKLMERRLTSFR